MCLVTDHLYIASIVAGRVHRHSHGKQGAISLEDLRQTAAMGLIHAARRFDPQRGMKFSTYAFPVLRFYMIDFIRGEQWETRRDRELAGDQPLHRMHRLGKREFVDSRWRGFAKVDDREQLRVLLRRLSRRDRKMLIAYGARGQRMKAIAAKWGVSEGWVSQRVRAAIEILSGE